MKAKREREEKRRDGFERSGAVLEGGGNDLHHVLQYMRESGEELPQRALQV